MKTRSALPVCLLATLLSASACTKVEEKVVTSLFQDYVAAQQALADDDYESARAALETLAAESSGEVKQLATKAAQAKDIEEVRRNFIQLSSRFSQLPIPDGYAVAFCPMADDGNGADWVQKEGKIANPYFGTRMRDCGTIQKKGQ